MSSRLCSLDHDACLV
jgi:hypothetical protein